MSRKKNFCETVDNEILRTPRYVSQKIEFATGKIVQRVQENPKMRTCAVIPGRLEFYCLRTSIESMDQGPVRQIQSGKIHWPEKRNALSRGPPLSTLDPIAYGDLRLYQNLSSYFVSLY